MTIQEAVDYLNKSLSDYFLLGNRVYSRVSLNWYLLDMTEQKWGNREIVECDCDGDEI